MRRLVAILGVAVVLAVTVSATAGWEDKTAGWAAQGLTGTSRLITDTNTDTLYYLRGTTVMSYSPATDTWTDLAATADAGAFGYESPNRTFYTLGGTAGRFISYAVRTAVQVYDIGTNHWSKYDVVPLPGGNAAWTQGAVYNPATGQYWAFWTQTEPEKKDTVGAPLDAATLTWGASREIVSQEGRVRWGRMESVNVGNTNYSRSDLWGWNCQVVHQSTCDLTDPDFPDIAGPWPETATHDLGEGHWLATGWATGWLAWGCWEEPVYGCDLYAAHGTDIYVVGTCHHRGADPPEPIPPMEAAVYHTATDSWEDIEDLPFHSNGYRNHTCAVVGGLLYVQDGNGFFVYSPGGVPGDVDGNGVVDGLDLTAVITAWETTPGDPLWNPDADLDGNNVIDGLDLTEVISNWTTAHIADVGR